MFSRGIFCFHHVDFCLWCSLEITGTTPRLWPCHASKSKVKALEGTTTRVAPSTTGAPRINRPCWSGPQPLRPEHRVAIQDHVPCISCKEKNIIYIYIHIWWEMRLEKNSETWGEMKQEIAKSDSCEKKTQANQLERAPCPYQPFKIHGLFTLNDVHLMAPPTLFHKSCPLGTREPRPLQPAKLLLWQSACSTSWWSMETKLQQTVTMNGHKQRWLLHQTSPFSDSRQECQVTWDSTRFQLLNLELIDLPRILPGLGERW